MNMEPNNPQIVQNRYDFILLFDVKDGNPNGDPDSDNLPRVDSETGEGLVTDVCIKRKVRNYIDYLHITDRPQSYEIYVKDGPILKDKISAMTSDEIEKLKKDAKKNDKKIIDLKREAMLREFYDIRAFGAVMSFKEANAGQVRGPIQLTFGRSIDPIFPHEHTIVPVVAANKDQTMGRKATVPYGLYKMYGFVTPHFAEDTGFTEDDLKLFWEALQNMFDLDHSAARGLMSLQKLIIFKHESPLGNASAHKLFERVTVARREGLAGPARDFSDYTVQIDRDGLQGVEVIELV